MKLEILGTGCAKCDKLAENVKATADKLGLDYEMSKVTDLGKIAGYGVMMTPALVVDGEVRISGKLASEAELTEILKAAAD